MKKDKLKIITDQRPFTIIFNDFIETDLLDWNEKRIFIILKKFADNNNQCFPSIKTLCKLSQLSNKTVIKALKKLEEKQIITKQLRENKQHGFQSNLYTLRDNAEMWNSESMDKLILVANETELEKSIRIIEAAGYTVTKEKEPETLPSVQRYNESSTKINTYNQHNTTTNSEESQEKEQYTIDQIHNLFEYDIMLLDYPDRKQDIDSVMTILYTTMNTGKPTIRIAGQDKPAIIVIGKLMKLDKESIMYAIKKFSEQTDRIKNPASYLLTILYNAPEQYYLDKKNHEISVKKRSEQEKEGKQTNRTNDDYKNSFANFKQRTYDYDALEEELLNRP